MKASFYRLGLNSGAEAPITLRYRHLADLERLHPGAFAEYVRVQHKKPEELSDLDTIRAIYTAYLCGVCAEGGNPKEAMEWEEFLDEVPEDRAAVADAMEALMGKKAADSRGRSR